MIEEVASIIARYRYTYASEDELQEGIAAALRDCGYDVERELRLDAASRIDLWTEGVGVEVKIDGRTSSVQRQLERYARFETIDALILVTSRGGRHGNLMRLREIGDKPFRIVVLRSL